jgi:alpha-tubulin suppressor-like RCC1 family protein
VISAGDAHTCAVTAAGGARCWGWNPYGQIGDGTTADRHTPVDVWGFSSGMATISAGSGYTCSVTSSGGAKCWGWNLFDQLGDGTGTDTPYPVGVSGLSSGAVAVSAGRYHTCAITTGGGAKCWGWNLYGQVGDGSTTNRGTPRNVSGLSSGVAEIAVGDSHSCALTTGGGVKCWGLNDVGQLGDGSTTNSPMPVDVSGLTSGVAEIAVGDSHSCALTTGGAVKCWGNNFYGQLGDGSTTSSSTPVNVSGLSSGATAISAGGNHTCAVDGGAAKCWGRNSKGQLGDGTTTGSSTPVSVSDLSAGVTAISAGDSHSCALTTGGRALCWGSNVYGQLGNGKTADRLTPVQVSSLFPGDVAQPDGLISKGGAFVGNGVYNTTGRNQTLSAKRAPGTMTSFDVRIQNDGDALDRILVRGEAPAKGFRVAVTWNGVAVTKDFLAGRLDFALDVGASETIVVKITIKATASAGKVESQKVTLTSTNDLTGKDAVKAKVTVSR